jgi:hypothetical protein
MEHSKAKLKKIAEKAFPCTSIFSPLSAQAEI